MEYACGDFVKWAKGCGKGGAVSPFDGNAKLLWKVEWAAKFFVLGVDIEGAGKDHSTKGGAREIADRIAREVYKIEPPVNIPYEFFHVRVPVGEALEGMPDQRRAQQHGPAKGDHI